MTDVIRDRSLFHAKATKLSQENIIIANRKHCHMYNLTF